MGTPTDVLKLAQSFVGYKSGGKPTLFGKWYAEHINDSYYANNYASWCAMFVSYCLVESGVSCPGIPGASCGMILNNAIAAGRVLADPTDAQPGMLVIFDWGVKDGSHDHIGIVQLNKGTYLQTIEGNTQDSECMIRTRAFDVVQAIINPYYDEEDTVTDADINKIASAVCEALSKEIWANYAHMGMSMQDKVQNIYEHVNDTSDPTGRGVNLTTHDHVKYMAALMQEDHATLDNIANKLGV